MSFKAIRSRLRNASDSDQGSPSRPSFFQQLTTTLLADDVAAQQEVLRATCMRLPCEHETLTVADGVAATDPSAIDSVQQTKPPAPKISRRLLERKDSVDYSDRDTESPAADEAAPVVRNRPSRTPPISSRIMNYTEDDVKTTRYRFSQRDKRRGERCKSLDRSGCAAMRTCISTEEINSAKAATNKWPMPHQRIADWARNLIGDLQTIDGNGPAAAAATVGVKDEDDQENPLTLKRLKGNIYRFARVTKPVAATLDSFKALRQWESPTASFLLLSVLCYSLWHGLFLSLVIAVCLWKLSVNYLVAKGWLDDLCGTVKDHTSADDATNNNDKSSGVTDRLTFLFHVARTVQNRLGDICDAAEKIKNLLMWRHESTGRLFWLLWLGLLITLLVPLPQLITVTGFYLLLKLFIIDYLFLRFPRLRAKYDTSIWQSLPTDADLQARDKLVQQGTAAAATGSGTGSVETRTFWESFNLPQSETPQPGWQNGLRCTLVNRDKSLTSSFKTGRLFLTDNYLCFERSKTHPAKNIVIPLDRIVRLEKGNQYAWIPGGGMIIEVFIQGLDRAYTFGAVMNRDETFSSIRDAVRNRSSLYQEDIMISNSTTSSATLSPAHAF